MSVSSQLPSEAAAILTRIDPDALAAATHVSDWVDMGGFEAVLAIVLAGTMGASATIDAKLEQATDDLGTGAKDVPDKAITQMTQAAPDQSGTQAMINCRGSELDMNGGYRFVRLSLTVGGAASDAGATVMGFGPRYSPASDHNAATVGEIIE